MLLHAGRLQAAIEVAQRLAELFLAGDAPCHVELAADSVRGVEQVHLVAALGQRGRCRQACRAGAHHREAASRGRAADHDFGLARGARIDQAGGQLVAEDVVEAGLIAGDAGVDIRGAPFARLGHEVRVRQQRPRHADHVGAAIGQHLLGNLGRVDTVAGDQRDADVGRAQLVAHLLRDPRKGAARHAGGDRGHTRLVPADAGVQQRGARFHDGPSQRDHFRPAAAVGNQVEHRQPVDDDEVRANGLAHPLHDLDRQPHPVLVRAAPGIGALVGVRDEELVDQVALAAHHLDAVVAGLARQRGAADERADLTLHASRRQFARRKRRDRTLDARRRHAERVIAIAARVQDLQCDAPALGVHGIGDLAVAPGRRRGGQRARERLGPAGDVGREAAGHDQAHAAARALGQILSQCGEMLAAVFEPGVHAAHQHAVGQGGEAQVERGQQVGVGCGHEGGW